MKTAKAKLHTQRQMMDKKLTPLKTLSSISKPRSGWLKAIRESLGLSARMIATRLDLDMAGVMRMEEREKIGTVTLAALDRAARAMNCRLVYAIVPTEEYSSLEDILDKRSMLTAQAIMKDVNHSMTLENQGVELATVKEQVATLAQTLKSKLDPKIWEK